MSSERFSMTSLHDLSEPFKHTVDALSLGAVAATLLAWLPPATIVLSFVWICLRCVESWQNVRLNDRKLKQPDE
jgi:hypothetical protein